MKSNVIELIKQDLDAMEFALGAFNEYDNATADLTAAILATTTFLASPEAQAVAVLPELVEALREIIDAYGCECIDASSPGHCPMCGGRAALAKLPQPE